MKKIILPSAIFLIFLASCQKIDEVLKDENLETIENVGENISKAFLINNHDPIVNRKPAFGLANADYNKMGPHQVASIRAERNVCKGLAGGIQKLAAALGITDPEIRCNNALPYGFSSPRVSEIFYPADIETLDKVPVISYVGGLFSSTVNYDAIVSLWVSYGFIVVNTTNFINFSPSLHITGLASLIEENRSSDSPLFNKVDLSKVQVSGHSAGAGAAILVSTADATDLESLDPMLKIIGSFPMQASFNASGDNVAVPTLNLTGEVDVIVIPELHPLSNQYRRMNKAPAWYMCTKNSTHGTPTYDLLRHDYAGITVAWLLYQAKNDRAAAGYFVGSNYRALQDQAFLQEKARGYIPGIPNLIFPKLSIPAKPSPIRVQRNSLADAL